MTDAPQSREQQAILDRQSQESQVPEEQTKGWREAPNRAENPCFACGPLNPIGLHLRFLVSSDAIRTTFVPRPEHQGYPGHMHGGLISTILDDAMANFLYLRGLPVVTARMEVRFKAPVTVGRPITATARLASERGGRVYEMEAQLQDEAGKVLAEGRATFMRVPVSQIGVSCPPAADLIQDST